MEGIMVLNTIKNAVYSFGWNPWCWLLIVPIAISVLLLCFYSSNSHRKGMAKWGVIGTLILAFSVATGIAVCSTDNVSYEYIYQVIVDNEVDMESFRSNYEILDQVGITYMIKQK